MNATLLRRAIRLQRRALLGWSIALALLTLLTLLSWPTIRDQAEDLQRVIDRLPPAMKAFAGDVSDATTGPGFIRGRLFGFMLPLLFAAYAIGRGADAVAGEEERGTLDLVLAHPVSRLTLVLERTAAIGLCVLLLALPLAVLLLVGDVAFTLHLDRPRVLLTLFMLTLHTWALGSVALAVGCATGRKAYAIAAASGLAVAGFLLEGLANLSARLEGLRYASTFYYYGGGKTLTTWDPRLGIAVLALVTVLGLLVAVLAFERRDVAVA